MLLLMVSGLRVCDAGREVQHADTSRVGRRGPSTLTLAGAGLAGPAAAAAAMHPHGSLLRQL